MKRWGKEVGNEVRVLVMRRSEGGRVGWGP
jgi:hypothetical protein